MSRTCVGDYAHDAFSLLGEQLLSKDGICCSIQLSSRRNEVLAPCHRHEQKQDPCVGNITEKGRKENGCSQDIVCLPIFATK